MDRKLNGFCQHGNPALDCIWCKRDTQQAVNKSDYAAALRVLREFDNYIGTEFSVINFKLYCEQRLNSDAIAAQINLHHHVRGNSQQELYPEPEKAVFDALMSACGYPLLISECQDILSRLRDLGYEVRPIEVDEK